MSRAKGQSGLKFSGFGTRVEERAKALGYANLSAFARDKKIDKGSVYAWADDRVPGADNLERLARDLEVEWQWLLVGDWSARPQEVAARDLPPKGGPCEHEIEAATMNKDDRDAWDLFVEFAKHRKGKREKEWGMVSRFVVFIAGLSAGQALQPDEKKPDAPKRRAAL